MSSKESRIRLIPGSTFDKYVIKGFIGHGSFGDIYSCEDERDHSTWAIKIELKTNKKTSLDKEAQILKKIQSSPYFPVFHDYGESDEYLWLVLELLGPSLIGARRISSGSVFSASTAIRLGIEMLRCIEAFHKFGLVHRDIKPGNFLIRPSRKHPLILIDFGLSKAFLDDNGEMIPPRDSPGFVGTVPYASFNAHKGLELGCCDDLFSWFVVLLKIHAGELPWPTVNNKDVVLVAKKEANIANFCEGLPHQYIIMYRLILSMKRDDIPNYSLFYQLLGEAMVDTNSSFMDRFDWELSPDEIIRTATTISLAMPRGELPEPPSDFPSDLVQRLMKKPEVPEEKNEDTNDTPSYSDDVDGCGCRI
ncbi:CK1 family protein kinase [Trichomonas vaginalis G3]|uniref:non-specific serine/threonine protein kinase n=1 Tax=Trichomonas vaginalis (strain ATCC PRA-98 / G3) TaxID=412133 RepID=A2FLP5_TRIV3|nr:protein kinase protein [Trichomonas vaginalis G3]EAX94180.1 CK1 family protein kinase [Trichomonas vaginalis G3]KAI5540680.1 protein kinase protein [Trichomonas vaginalis G3]|eukprot:XP_001307110.1 CK1 family protein kinase [Trichomonas vaginalis G3]